MAMKTKVDQEEDIYQRGYHEREEPSRIDLNDLLRRSKEEKAKTKKINFLVFSAVVCSAALVIVIISYL